MNKVKDDLLPFDLFMASVNAFEYARCDSKNRLNYNQFADTAYVKPKGKINLINFNHALNQNKVFNRIPFDCST